MKIFVNINNGKVDNNGRIYPKNMFQKAFSEYIGKMNNNIIGEMSHPD